MSQTDPIPSPSDDDRDSQADKVGSYFLGDNRLGITRPDDKDHPRPSYAPRKKQPRTSRRGGKAHPEPSDSELDPHMDTSHLGELTDEEMAAKSRGVKAAREALRRAAEERNKTTLRE